MDAEQNPPRKRPTLRDVAERAGVTVGVASRAINGSLAVTREVWDAVDRAARELVVPPDGLLRRTDQVHAADLPLPMGRLWKLVNGRVIPVG
jgi:LacI family transcriptional regulator